MELFHVTIRDFLTLHGKIRNLHLIAAILCKNHKHLKLNVYKGNFNRVSVICDVAFIPLLSIITVMVTYNFVVK